MTAIIPTDNWHTSDISKVVLEVESDLDQGLQDSLAETRLTTEGANTLPEPPGTKKWKLFLGQFNNLVIWVLLVAGIVSGVMGEAIDAIAILTIVFLNGIIGFFQEYNAEQSIAALRKMTAPMAKVLRSGLVRSIPAKALVRGDVIELEAGDLVPADARLFQVFGLRSLEAALTGESESVLKVSDTLPTGDVSLGDRHNMIYMGTSIASGAGKAIVVRTGSGTEIGKIASLLESAGMESETPLQKRMNALSKTLVWVCLGIVAILFLIGLLRGRDLFQQFMTAVSLAVAAAPEGLPAIVTVALALGVRRMAKRKALVRRLPSVETLGSATVICTDKTGTLTAGEMTVKEFYVDGETFIVGGGGLDPVGTVLNKEKPTLPEHTELLRNLALAQAATTTASLYAENGQWKVAGDPTEGALIAAGRKLGLSPQDQSKSEMIFSFPFDSDRKRASAIQKWKNDSARIHVNGAPDVLLDLCTRVHSKNGIRVLEKAERDSILKANLEMAGRGLRVLGTAYRDDALPKGQTPKVEDVEKDLVFLGLTGMYDPPRPEAKKAVTTCLEAGIRVVMITGDHPSTALAIAKELGIAKKDDETLTGSQMDGMDDASLQERVVKVSVFARVTAAHKLRVINAWKGLGAIVAMTGDGVNDAPALKGAHIGIAMGRSGTEVTKQASDMIIADDNFATIVAAVEEGRGIYQNIRNTLQFLLAGNAGELLFMTASIIIGLPLPLLPIHLLWINLVTDGLPALCLASERIDPDVMKKKPRTQSEILSDRNFLFSLLLTGFLTAGVSLAAFVWGLKTYGLEVARALAFTALVLAELLRSLGARSETRLFLTLDPRGNPLLLLVVGFSILLQVFLHQNETLSRLLKIMPLSGVQWFVLFGLASIPLLVLECLKLLRPINGKQLRIR